MRNMTEAELKMALSWADKEGWNPGKYDSEFYYPVDQDGYLLLSSNDNENEPIGSISAVKYGDLFAFIGLFIVKPEYRKKGYGAQLWMAAMNIVKQCTTVALYAVPQETARYEKSGFAGDYKVHRWQINSSEALSEPKQLNYFIDSSEDSDFEKLISYDTALWGASRKAFFEALMKGPEVEIFISLDKNTNELNGYGVIRPCMHGYRIGPIYANRAGTSIKLVQLLLSTIPTESFIIFDIPSKNPNSSIFANALKLERNDSGDTLAMTKGNFQDRGEEHCFGVASLEIG